MNVELINTLKNRINNKDYAFSNYEILLIFNTKELLSYLKDFLAKDYNNWNELVYNNFFPEIFEYIEIEENEDIFFNYLLYSVNSGEKNIYLLEEDTLETYITNVNKIKYLKERIHYQLSNGLMNVQDLDEQELKVLLDNKYYFAMSKCTKLKYSFSNYDLLERIKREYPFNKLTTPLFLNNYLSEFTDSFNLFDLSALINYGKGASSAYEVVKEEINKRLTNIDEIKAIKDFDTMDNFNFLLKNYSVQERISLEKYYYDNGIYFTCDLLFRDKINYNIKDMIEKSKIDDVSYNSLKYLVKLKKNKEINDYLNEHLDIFIQKGELAFVYDNFRVNGDVTNYYVQEINNNNPLILNQISKIDISLYENIDLFRAIVSSGKLKTIVFNNYILLFKEHKELLINWIKTTSNIDIDYNSNNYNEIITDEDILIALLETNNLNISMASVYNVLSIKDMSSRLFEVVKNTVKNNNDYALKLLGIKIFEYDELLDIYLDKDDLFKEKLIDLVNHNEGLEYSENFYQKAKDYLVRKYNIKLEDLDYIESKFGPNIIRYIDNENIQTLINMDINDIKKITNLFPKTKFNMQDMESTYDAIKQYEFYQNNPNIVQIFPNMLHMIEDNNDDYYIYLMELYKVIDKDFFNDFWQKYDNQNKEYYENNPHELLLLITEKIKNSPKKEKYIDMLHFITNYYISKKRIEYRKTYNVYEDLNIEYEYNQKQLFEFAFNYYIKNDLKYFNISSYPYIEEDFLNVLQINLVNKGMDVVLFNDIVNYICGKKENFNYEEKEIIKNIKLLKQETKIIFDNNYSAFYQNEFMIKSLEESKKVKKEYKLEDKKIDIYKILSSLRYDILINKLLPNEEVYTSLLSTMKKRKIYLMPDILIDYLDKSNIDLKYSDNYLESFISFYYLIYEKEKRLLTEDNKDLILKLPSVLKNAETFASVSSLYSQILTNEDARLIRANDGPNRATRKLMNNERLKEAVNYTISNYKRVHNLVPPVNKVFEYDDKRLRCIVGNFTNPCNITHGERTGACMRIGGVGESLYNFVLTDEAGFHIRFENPLNGEYISRVSGFRNGNTIFLNELRDSRNMKEYSNYDLYNICKLLGEYLINITKNDKVPIENVVLHKAYASENVSDKVVNLNVSNIKEGLKPFYTDVSNNVLVLATSSKENMYSPVKLGNQNVQKYLTCRDKITVVFDKEKMIEVANRVHSINSIIENKSIDNIDVIEIDDNFVYGICNHDWYIYVDKNNKIYHEIINIDSRAIEEYNNALMAIEEKFNLTKEVATYGL